MKEGNVYLLPITHEDPTSMLITISNAIPQAVKKPFPGIIVTSGKWCIGDKRYSSL